MLRLTFGGERSAAAVQRFIARENIKRYKQMLDSTTDEQQRSMLRDLLAKEEALLASLEPEKPTHPAAPESRTAS
jgi:hypothetical protein